MSPQITAHSRRSGNVFPLCLGSALRLLGILPSPSTPTRKRTTSRSECAFCLSTLCEVRFLVPPREKRPSVLPLWERPFFAPDDSLGALTSTSTLARIFVRAASISRHVRDGRPAVLRAACVGWLLKHRGAVFVLRQVDNRICTYASQAQMRSFFARTKKSPLGAGASMQARYLTRMRARYLTRVFCGRSLPARRATVAPAPHTRPPGCASRSCPRAGRRRRSTCTRSRRVRPSCGRSSH